MTSAFGAAAFDAVAFDAAAAIDAGPPPPAFTYGDLTVDLGLDVFGAAAVADPAPDDFGAPHVTAADPRGVPIPARGGRRWNG